MENSKSLIDVFEDSISNCTLAFTKLMSSMDVDKDDIKLEVEQTTLKFIDLARQMDCFFLQKRCLLSKTKPELLLKEENADLRHEIARKDDQLNKHVLKIAKWKELLSDPRNQAGGTQQQHPDGALPPHQPNMPVGPGVGPMGQRFQMPVGHQPNMPMSSAPGMFPNHQNMRPNFPPAQPHIGGAPNNPLAFLESISKTTNNLDPR